MEVNKIYNEDCLIGLKKLPENSIDLIITDPPYQINNTTAGGKTKLAKSIQNMNNEISENDLVNGFNLEILDELVRVNKGINMYIWCNKAQIPMYFNYFIYKLDCSFDIIKWTKTNAMPLFNNKYLSDTEYCLYFRKDGYCNPPNYELAKTSLTKPINITDKVEFGHPTIKPLEFMERFILNSSKENDIILDPFIGSGTTAVASVINNRKYIGYEYNKKYYEIAVNRIEKEFSQTRMF